MQATLRRFITLKQESNESLDGFAKRFLSQQEVTEDVWGELIPHKMKGKAVVNQEKARDKFLACVFLAGVDGNRYGTAVDDLNNDFLLGTVSFPDDVPGMMTLLSNRRGGGKKENKYVNALKDGMVATSFMQQEKRTCFCCGKPGHIAPTSPERDTKPRKQWHMNKEEGAALLAQTVSDDDSETRGVGGVDRNAEYIGWNM
jgi:hypothetical protein